MHGLPVFLGTILQPAFKGPCLTIVNISFKILLLAVSRTKDPSLHFLKFYNFLAKLKGTYNVVTEYAFSFPGNEDTESHPFKARKPHKDFQKSCADIPGESCLSNFSLIGANGMILAFDLRPVLMYTVPRRSLCITSNHLHVLPQNHWHVWPEGSCAYLLLHDCFPALERYQCFLL